MTAKEKLQQMFPKLDLSVVMENCCPSEFNFPYECDGNFNSEEDCRACWDTEIRENEDCSTQPQIRDSGNRREFETGAVRDMQEGKGRFDLLPWAAIMEIAKHCENGSKKYGEHNVDRGIKTSSFLDSACRHIAKYLDGWTDEPHLIAAAWNLLWAIQMEIKNPEMVDTPWKKEQTDENE